ncbi:hypothetical protein CC80DRAFT_230786 [Byssothecium circinans]|uniref:Conserved oligomeric Golgi complex subunit 1 n=1 Tax=Byssothecium circinans TaxID=147558 RepID=A0A6A5UJ83_9PLEO|nr:hypothetical protein CC80DRAFT_230786 [Byssothecium circinans]
MEVSMERVETKLAQVGQNCNSRNLERIAGNAGKMDAHERNHLERYTFASQLAVLRNCPVVMTRLLKSEGSFLLIAKVLVVSRLLHKALSQSKSKPPIVNQLWERLLSFRRKLLRRIDKRLANSTGDISTLVESMCAYALATSSTPSDVLQHFHKIRLEKVLSSLQNGHEELAKHGTASLKLCIQTCQDTQTIFPRRLADSLAKLKIQPLIQDAGLRALYELNLDIHDRWIGDEARNYTPWPRHDELQRADAERILHQWSKQAIAAFLKGVKKALEEEDRLREVASLRSELIEVWLISGSRMAGVKSANVLDDMRDTMNNHLETIVRSRTQNLKTVVTAISSKLDSWPTESEASGLSLWSTVAHTNDLSNGAVAFKTKILNTHQGRDEPVINVVSTFDAWMESVLQVKSIVKSMKEARWDDTFVDDVDDSDDDDFGESKQTLLSGDDPRLLEDVTQEALGDAFHNLGKSFTKIVRELTEDEEAGGVQQACFVLRIMREISERIPSLRLQDKATPLATPFTLELLEPLHTALAKRVVQPATTTYKKSLARTVKMRTKGQMLWEGHPPLPAQPSHNAFSYLQGLTKTMGTYGSDLWTPASVAVLKSIALGKATKLLESNISTISKIAIKSAESASGKDSEEKSADDTAEPKTNGETPAAADPSPLAAEVRDQKLRQAIFDALYVQRFVGDAEKHDAIDSLLKSAVGESGLDESSLSRLKNSAADYAKKTYLLFALLA